jgi:DNA-binding IclR family transcriptional regulator
MAIYEMASHNMKQHQTKSSLYRIHVLERVVAILDVLAGSNTEESLVELTQTLGLHKSTTHRLLMALESTRLVERDASTGKYRLGSKLLELGMRVAARLKLPEAARPYLERLSHQSSETAHVGVLRGSEVVSIANCEGQHTLRMPATVGTISPGHCTSLGKAMLAFLREEEAKETVLQRGLKGYTRNTITQLSALKAEWQKVRECGFAVDDEEFEQGLKCIGAPVRDSSGRVIAAISIAGAAFRLKDDRIPALARAVKQAASDLSRDLGYRQDSAEEPEGRPCVGMRRDRDQPPSVGPVPCAHSTKARRSQQQR